MCGIFGVLNDGFFDEGKFKKALNLLSHRGPDSQKSKFWENVKFGFSRLSIQDLSDLGNQPMSLQKDPLHIVFNGEIYNFKSLREELQKLGAEFFSATDTEVILHAYKKWGIDKTLEKLEGMFAFSLYDEKAHIIYMARDRFGQKPFFYSTRKGFIFSSEIKAILEYSGYRKINLINSLNPIFMTGLSPKGTSMFDGVNQLEAGELLEFSLKTKQITKRQYFHVSDWVDQELYQTLSRMAKKDILKIYNDAIDASLKTHLLCEANLGSLFSAGLDSSLITAFARNNTNKPINLYYFESENQKDNSKRAIKFSKLFNCNLKTLKGNDEKFIFDLPKMMYHYETINKEEGAILGNLCRLARKDGLKVLLTGDASDELFGGQSFHCHFYTQSFYFNNHISNFFKKFLNHYAPHSFLNYSGQNPVQTHFLNFPPGIGYLSPFLDYKLYLGERLPEWQKCLEAYSFIKNKCQRDTRAYILDEIGYRLQRFMIRSDRFGMMESIEVRTPFLDPSLVKLAINTPIRWLIHLRKPLFFSFEKKYLIRELAKKAKIPKDIIYRKKLATVCNNKNQKRILFEKFPLSNLSEILNLKPSTLSNMVSQSDAVSADRTQYAFLASEILIKLFIKEEKPDEIKAQIEKTLKD